MSTVVLFNAEVSLTFFFKKLYWDELKVLLHNSGAPDAFAEFVKVMNHTEV